MLARLIQWWSMGQMWPIKLVCTALLSRSSYREQALSSATIVPPFLLPVPAGGQRLEQVLVECPQLEIHEAHLGVALSNSL